MIDIAWLFFKEYLLYFFKQEKCMRMKFYFKVKTKSGGIVGNILIEAKDQYEAENKLRQRYPDCQILNCEVK